LTAPALTPARYPRRSHITQGDAQGRSVRHFKFEPTFGETRRRVKVIGRLPGETSCLTLVWAVLDCASRGWRGFTMTASGLRLRQDLRRSLLEPSRQLRPRAVTAAHIADSPKLSVPPPPNLINEAGTTTADLHRIPDATDAPSRSHLCDSWSGGCPGISSARIGWCDTYRSAGAILV
jgi:hypothetical protein